MLLKVENWNRHLICWIHISNEFTFIYSILMYENGSEMMGELLCVVAYVWDDGNDTPPKIEWHLNNANKCEMMLNLLCNMFAWQSMLSKSVNLYKSHHCDFAPTRQFDTNTLVIFHSIWNDFMCHITWISFLFGRRDRVSWQEPSY